MLGLIKVALYQLLNIAQYLILARVILSWLPLSRNKFIEILYVITEPILAPIRNLLSKSMGASGMYIDFSPIIAFLIISFLQRMIITL